MILDSYILIIFVGVIMLFGFGMSAELDKDAAHELIVSEQGYPSTLVLRLPVGRVVNSLMIRTSAASDYRAELAVSQIEHSSKSLRWLEGLFQGGIIDFSHRIAGKKADPEKGVLQITVELRIELTKRGKNVLREKRQESLKSGLGEAVVLDPGDEMSETIQGDYTCAFLKICKKNIIAVTDLSFYDEKNAAAQYLWQYEDFTTLGNLFRAQQLRFCPEFLKVINIKTAEKFNDALDTDIHRGRATFTMNESGWRIVDLRD